MTSQPCRSQDHKKKDPQASPVDYAHYYVSEILAYVFYPLVLVLWLGIVVVERVYLWVTHQPYID